MGNLFRTLRSRLDVNAQRAVEVYIRELADYRSLAAEARGSAAMLDFAVILRRRTIELAAEDQSFTEQDQAYMASVGAARGEVGVSLVSQRQVLLLHANLTLREIHEAAGPNDLGDVMRILGWIAHHGLTAQNAYTRGYLKGQEHFLPVVARIQMLARMLLSGDLAAPQLAGELDLPMPDHYLVTIARISGCRPDNLRRDEVVKTLLNRHRIPLTWHKPDEFAALVPCDDDPIDGQAAARSQALSLIRDFAELSGPCSVGVAPGRGACAGGPALAGPQGLPGGARGERPPPGVQRGRSVRGVGGSPDVAGRPVAARADPAAGERSRPGGHARRLLPQRHEPDVHRDSTTRAPPHPRLPAQTGSRAGRNRARLNPRRTSAEHRRHPHPCGGLARPALTSFRTVDDRANLPSTANLTGRPAGVVHTGHRLCLHPSP